MALNTTALASMLQKREKGYLDVISAQIPLFHFLRRKKQYKSHRGGSSLEWDVEFLLDENEPSFAGNDVLPVNASDSVQVAQATWKSYYKSMTINGEENDLNMGEQIFKLMGQKEKNALTSMQQQMNDHFYLDGTANGGKRITGLAAIIPVDPTTGTLFNINRATAGNEFWRSQHIDTNDGAFQTTPGTFTLRNDMDDLFIRCSRQKTNVKSRLKPDLILCTETYWRLYSQGVDIRGQRFTNTNVADAAFESLRFQGAELVFDQDMPADAGSDDQAYFINSANLTLNYIASANFKTGAPVHAESQDVFSRRLIWRGELTSNNPQKLGLNDGVKAVEAT